MMQTQEQAVTQSGQLSGSLSFSGSMSKEDEEMSKTALSTFRAKEEEIEKKKLEVRERVQAQLGRIEQETKRLANIREVFYFQIYYFFAFFMGFFFLRFVNFVSKFWGFLDCFRGIVYGVLEIMLVYFVFIMFVFKVEFLDFEVNYVLLSLSWLMFMNQTKSLALCTRFFVLTYLFFTVKYN